jgi:hypothetical protein
MFSEKVSNKSSTGFQKAGFRYRSNHIFETSQLKRQHFLGQQQMNQQKVRQI